MKSDGSGNPSDILSIQVTTYAATGGTGSPRVDNYNFRNIADTKWLSLEEVMGADFKTIIDEKIKVEMAAHPELYFAEEFKGISDAQSYYVEGDEVVVMFPKYSIAPGSTGTPEFRIAIPAEAGSNGTGEVVTPPAKVQATLAKDVLYVDQNGIEMIPLRQAAEALGYEIKWDGSTQTVELNKGAQWTSITVGKDAYFFAKMAPSPLGAAPVINSNGFMYVPSSFLTEILKANVEKAADGSLQISQ
ncbi:Protease inhibitor precursor [compost metagenome]